MHPYMAARFAGADFQCKEHAAQKLPGGMCKLVSLFNCAVYRLSASFCSICLRQAYTVSGVLLRFVYQPDNYVVEQLDFVIPDDGFEVRFADSGIVCEEHIISACHYRERPSEYLRVPFGVDATTGTMRMPLSAAVRTASRTL